MTASPILASTRAELAELLADRRTTGSAVALVPTMGALHEGHASLMRRAVEAAGRRGVVVASIFVNPLQFGAGEDLDRYPRTLDDDVALCGAHGVEVVFAPSVEEMYPLGVPRDDTIPGVTVDPGPLGNVLEGATRPGHFRGVLTVVAKLFGLVRPDLAVFGEKDYQQLALIRRMAADLCLHGALGPIEIVGAETVREDDGLAMSSRNRYLDADQRQQAAILSRALRAAQDQASFGVEASRAAALEVLATEPEVELDYVALTDADLGEPPVMGDGRILIAARVGNTRLIDNLPITWGGLPAPTSSPHPASTASAAGTTSTKESD